MRNNVNKKYGCIWKSQIQNKFLGDLKIIQFILKVLRILFQHLHDTWNS